MIQNRRGKNHLLLNLFGCFLIPAYTLLFAGSITWFGTNFSVIAVTGRDHYRGFFLWGLLAGSFFLVVMVRVIHRLPGFWGKLPLYVLTWLAVAALAYTLMIPYLPENWPGYAALHVVLAAGSCVLLMVDMLLVLLRRCVRDWKGWRGCLLAWAGIALGSGLIFLMGGMVTSALEVFFTITATLLLRSMYLRSLRH